jgi:hypothetical protein
MQSTRTVTARELAAVLRESQVYMVARVLRVLGEERVIAILADTLTCEHEGGISRNRVQKQWSGLYCRGL